MDTRENMRITEVYMELGQIVSTCMVDFKHRPYLEEATKQFLEANSMLDKVEKWNELLQREERDGNNNDGNI